MKKTFFYSCVPGEQLEQQRTAFHSLGAAEASVYLDECRGRHADRPQLGILKCAGPREGDELVVPSLDCLGDNEQQIRDELQWLASRCIRIRVLDIPATMADRPGWDAQAALLTGELLVEFYDAVILRKKAYKHQRQTEGISAARAKGVRFGRPPLARDPKFAELKQRWEAGEISLREGGRQLGVTHKTFQKWVTAGANVDNGGMDR